MSQLPEMDRRNPDNDAPQVVQPGLEPYKEVYPISPDVAYKQHQSHAYPNDRQGPSPTHRTICGLRVVTFWLSLALVLVIVLAAAIGGGVGGTLDQNGSQKTAVAQSTRTPSKTATGAPTTVTIAAPASPTSDCLQLANQNYTSAASSLSYTLLCGTDLNIADSVYQNYFEAMQDTFENCILMCDTYNYHLGTKNVTSINYNYGGTRGEPKGLCWCTQALPGKYAIMNSTGHDSAWLAGTFEPADVP